MKTKIIIVTLFVLILVISTYIYWKMKPNTSIVTRRLEQIQYESAKSARYSGNYDTAISKLRNLLSKPDDMKQLGFYTIFLADTLYLRNQNDDMAQSMKLYRELANSKTTPPSTRASALNSIAKIVVNNNVAFYNTYFLEPPFDTMLSTNPDSTRAIQDTYLKILELSDKIYPNSAAKYAIAGGYYVPLVFNQQIKEEDREKTARLIQKYISDAKNLDDDSNYSDNTYITRYLNGAMGTSISGAILKLSPKEREQGYTLAMEKIRALEEKGVSEMDLVTKLTILRTKFNYASFLISLSDEKRYPDIKDLLRDLSHIENHELQKDLEVFLLSYKKDKNDQMYKNIILLSNISPEFKELLEKADFF